MFIDLWQERTELYCAGLKPVEADVQPEKNMRTGRTAYGHVGLEHLVMRSGERALQNMVHVFRRQLYENDLQLCGGGKKPAAHPLYREYEKHVRTLLAPHWHGPARGLKKFVRRSLKPFRKSAGLLHRLLATPARITATACMLVLLCGYRADASVPFSNTEDIRRVMAPAPVKQENRYREVFFVDASLPDHQTLLRGAPGGVPVVSLKPSRNLIGQMLDYLLQTGPVESLHLFTHGAPGQLNFGRNIVNMKTLRQQEKQLRLLGTLLTGSRDIYLYGCQVAAGREGKDFLRLLSSLTGADVAASDDFTGPAARGGDWELELVVGRVNDRVISSEDYGFLLASGKVIMGDGSGGGGGGGDYIDSGKPGGAGGGGNDTVTGTNGDDVLFGDGSGGGGGGSYYGSNYAGAGGAGGSGNDTLLGGPGNDILFGDGFDGISGGYAGGDGGLGGGGGGGGGGYYQAYSSGGAGGIGGGGGGGGDYAAGGSGGFGGGGGGGGGLAAGGTGGGFGATDGVTSTSDEGGGGGGGGYAGGGGGTGGYGTNNGGTGGNGVYTTGGGTGGNGGGDFGGGGGGGGLGGGNGGNGGDYTAAATAGAPGGTAQVTIVDTPAQDIYTRVKGKTLTALAGGSGNDTLDGGPGSDDLHGMGGTNTFVFESDDATSGSDVDTIYGWKNGAKNRIVLKTGGAVLYKGQVNAILAAQTRAGADRTIVHADGANKVTIVVKDIGRDLVTSDFDIFPWNLFIPGMVGPGKRSGGGQ